MTAPEIIVMLPPPVQKAVPPFSSVRPVRNTALGPTFRVAPVSTIVRPLPLIAPAVHEKYLRTVSVPLPVSVGAPFPASRERSRQSAGGFKVTVAPRAMATMSFEPGARLGVQFVAEFQSPLTK